MREIVTHEIPKAAMWEELTHLASRLAELGQEQCDVLFGFAWGNDYYPTSKWNDVRLAVADLIKEVQRVEAAKYGKLGDDDLIVRISALGLEFKFCNDSDIHISFAEPSDITASFYSRWMRLGYGPAEYSNTDKDGPGERLRNN